MSDERTIEDRLREEYFDLLPDIRRVTVHLEAEVKYFVLPISRKLEKYEQLVVKSRFKECESALDALRRRQEGGEFEGDRATPYTLKELHDLAGVRVLAFPSSRLAEIEPELRKRFASWKADPVLVPSSGNGQPLASKYSGYCEASANVRGELQIVSMLVGLFWEVEHSGIYKPIPQLKGIDRSRKMKPRLAEVYDALKAFDEEFEAHVREETRK